jgi:hypothetical protein
MKPASVVGRLCLAFLVSCCSAVSALADEAKDESKGTDGKQWSAADKDQRKYKKERQYTDEHKCDADRRHSDDREQSRDPEQYCFFHERGYTNLRIPEGHLPRPGQCRVWYAAASRGDQPPAGRCDRVSRHVPPGAWLIARSTADPAHVTVQVYDGYSPGVVVAIGVFRADTGVFVRYQSP